MKRGKECSSVVNIEGENNLYVITEQNFSEQRIKSFAMADVVEKKPFENKRTRLMLMQLQHLFVKPS